MGEWRICSALDWLVADDQPIGSEVQFSEKPEGVQEPV
jgi:hypothetical protein